MARHVLLLRGINIGARNRISMRELRKTLAEAGFEDVRTHLQSGNVVLASGGESENVAAKVAQQISARFGLEIPVLARTHAELAAAVKRNPLGRVAVDPKRHLVTFLSGELGEEVVRKLEGLAVPPEKVVAMGREVYSWHPETIARSRLWTELAGKRLGVTATSRNWSTVQALLALAGE
ncbi:MAG: DUF1697 domain-containing protein [Gaiellaceae bacterium]